MYACNTISSRRKGFFSFFFSSKIVIEKIIVENLEKIKDDHWFRRVTEKRQKSPENTIITVTDGGAVWRRRRVSEDRFSTIEVTTVTARVYQRACVAHCSGYASSLLSNADPDSCLFTGNIVEQIFGETSRRDIKKKKCLITNCEIKNRTVGKKL